MDGNDSDNQVDTADVIPRLTSRQLSLMEKKSSAVTHDGSLTSSTESDDFMPVSKKDGLKKTIPANRGAKGLGNGTETYSDVAHPLEDSAAHHLTENMDPIASPASGSATVKKPKRSSASARSKPKKPEGAQKKIEDIYIRTTDPTLSLHSKAPTPQPTQSPVSFPDPLAVLECAEQYPDNYSIYQGAIERIDLQNPLLAPMHLHHSGGIWGLTWSSDFRILATCSTFGTVRLWDVEDNFSLIKEIYDEQEGFIEEYYVAKFTPSDRHLVVGGKLKDGKIWDSDDDDNKIIPGPLKIFDLQTGKVVNKLEGHEEEILCLKRIEYKGDPYFVSCGQDGLIYKWRMDKSYTQLQERTLFVDPTSSIIMTLAFVPNCANRYLLATVDDGIRIYDFETAQKLQEFRDIYSSYCDCAKFVSFADTLTNPLNVELRDINTDWQTNFARTPNTDKSPSQPLLSECFLVTRGVELLVTEELENPTEGTSSKDKRPESCQRLRRPNSCHLMKLVLPTEKGEQFKLVVLKEYSHPQ
eukprot:TRINITY_DN4797_c0_g1_i6.p1 TRINITY_DN4797_c0_g1~~TRINITY_DN4797_c0_g1_i6.p1  ORF type:complete len:526 (+),score=92.28 TRINITY_DN4797_c0_g1_i6:54-1631(+)